MALADERCEVCRPGMPTLTPDEARALLDDVAAAWAAAEEPQRITRTVDVDDFGAAMALAVRIGFVAETEGHHPDLLVSWGCLRIDIHTHAAGGLTRNDFVLAAKIDRLVGESTTS